MMLIWTIAKYGGANRKNLPVLLFQITKEINKIVSLSPKIPIPYGDGRLEIERSIPEPLRFSLASKLPFLFPKIFYFFVSEIILFPIVRFVNLFSGFKLIFAIFHVIYIHFLVVITTVSKIFFENLLQKILPISDSKCII